MTTSGLSRFAALTTVPRVTTCGRETPNRSLTASGCAAFASAMRQSVAAIVSPTPGMIMTPASRAARSQAIRSTNTGQSPPRSR